MMLTISFDRCPIDGCKYIYTHINIPSNFHDCPFFSSFLCYLDPAQQASIKAFNGGVCLATISSNLWASAISRKVGCSIGRLGWWTVYNLFRRKRISYWLYISSALHFGCMIDLFLCGKDLDSGFFGLRQALYIYIALALKCREACSSMLYPILKPSFSLLRPTNIGYQRSLPMSNSPLLHSCFPPIN